MSSQNRDGHRQDDRRLPPISQIFNIPPGSAGEPLSLPPLRRDGNHNTSEYPQDPRYRYPQSHPSVPGLVYPQTYPSGTVPVASPGYSGHHYQQSHAPAPSTYATASRASHGHPYSSSQVPSSSHHRDLQRPSHPSMAYSGPGVPPSSYPEGYHVPSPPAYPNTSASVSGYPAPGGQMGYPGGPPLSRDVRQQENVDDPSQKTKYECNYCGKGFLRPSALKIHLISHTGDKDFVCPEESCKRRFGVRSNMLRHIRLVHQNLQQSAGDELEET